MANKIYSEYDSFAFFYNEYWTVSAPYYLEEALERLLFDEIDKDCSILDVCCGTGNIASLLLKRGYNVSGLDGSKAMLDYAKENAKGVTFYHADVRNFQLKNKYKVITCLFDSINHILDKDDVLKAFQNIYDHLENDGIFIFDVNSLSASENSDQSDFSAIEEDSVFISQSNYNKRSRIITYNLVSFIKESGSWQRLDHKILEKYYDKRELFDMLKQAGFINIIVVDGSDIGIDIFQDRLFFKAWK